MPKNPVRAARQAGRQQVKAAKQASRVAKIETRFADKVAKINAAPAAKSEPKVKARPVAKTMEVKSSAPASTTSVKKARPGIKGRIAEAAYNRKAKKTVFDASKVKPATKLPAAATPSTKLNITNDMRGTLKDMPADTRTAKVNKMKADDARKKQEAAKKKEATKKKDGYGYVPEMFLDPKKGETRQNTLPYAFTDKANSSSTPKTRLNYTGIGSYDRMKNNAYGQAPEKKSGKIDYTRKRNGGSIKRKK